MGKNLVVAAFLLTCIGAAYVLLTRTESNIVMKEGDAHASTEPRLSLEDFTVYQYENYQAVATLSGKLAIFLDPNLLELYGSVRGLRHNSEKKEFFTAEAATVFFEGKSLSDLIDQPAKIKKVELEDNVNIGVKFNRIITDFAEYFPEKELLQSNLPVELKGPRGDFSGRGGFTYQLDQEHLKVGGPIDGVMQGTELGKHRAKQ